MVTIFVYMHMLTCTCWHAHNQISCIPYHPIGPSIFTFFIKFARSPVDSYHYHFMFDYRRGWELEYYFMHSALLLCYLLSSYFLWYQRQRGLLSRKSKRNAFRIFCFHFLILRCFNLILQLRNPERNHMLCMYSIKPWL